MYGAPRKINSAGATVLAEAVPPYFNRSYKAWCSHQHTPDDPDAAPLGPVVTENDGIAYIAYPIFDIYHRYGQPLYKYVVGDLIARLMPDRAVDSDLPSSGRVSLTRQEAEGRHILHLLYGAPQVRGKAVPTDTGTRIMEMIEDIPAIGPVTASVRLPSEPSRVYDALSGKDVPFEVHGDGSVQVALPGLHIHSAIVFENSV